MVGTENDGKARRCRQVEGRSIRALHIVVPVEVEASEQRHSKLHPESRHPYDNWLIEEYLLIPVTGFAGMTDGTRWPWATPGEGNYLPGRYAKL